MRSIIRSTDQLSALRFSVRRDVFEPGDDTTVLEDFVGAVNEVVAAAVTDAESGVEAGAASIDVRWRRQTQPQIELFAEIRNASGTPRALLDESVAAKLLHHYAERVQFDDRIGGSVITLRCRV